MSHFNGRRGATPIAILAIIVAACSSDGDSGSGADVYLPIYTRPDVPDALVEGKVVREGPCLFLEAGDHRFLILWPEGVRFDDPDIVDESGATVATVGSDLEDAGGGATSLATAKEVVEGGITESACETPQVMIVVFS